MCGKTIPVVLVVLFLATAAMVAGQGPEPPKKTGDLKYAPEPFATKMYYEGAQTIGRVGHEAILKRDILHQLKKQAFLVFREQEREQLPPNADAKLREELKRHIFEQFMTSPQIYSSILDGYIKKLLFYDDFVVSRPKEQVKEQEKKLGVTYDTEYLPQFQKQIGIEKREDLERFFAEELQSTLEQDRRIFICETLAVSWLEFNLGEDQYVPSSQELRRYYDMHKYLYTTEAKVRWQAVTVKIGNHPDRQTAYNKIAQMGNMIMKTETFDAQSACFAETARTMSEDLFASKGGDRGWTRKGALSVAAIEKAIFSDELPVGSPSRILDCGDSFVIVRVLERFKDGWKPFIDVQQDVKKRLLADRRKALTLAYEDKLSKRFTIELYNISPEERRTHLEALFKENKSATGRDVY